MKRRQFLATAGAATLASALTQADGTTIQPKPDTPQLIELRRYTMPLGGDQQRLHGFIEEVLMPAYNRMEVGPIGTFTVLYGQTAPTLYVVLPYASMDVLLASRARLFEDETFSSAVDTDMDEAHPLRQ